MTRKKLTFEEALTQLETITAQIEQGKIGLEESIAKYEEGMALVKQCRDILGRAELRIQQLQEAADGSLEATPFEQNEAGQPATAVTPARSPAGAARAATAAAPIPDAPPGAARPDNRAARDTPRPPEMSGR